MTVERVKSVKPVIPTPKDGWYPYQELVLLSVAAVDDGGKFIFLEMMIKRDLFDVFVNLPFKAAVLNDEMIRFIIYNKTCVEMS